MSLISLAFENGQPIIRAFIGLSQPRQQAVAAAGQVVPQPVLATLLIDTGASNTCIDPECVAPLGLQPTGSVPIQTPSTNGVAIHCVQYDVSIIIPSGSSSPPHIISALPILESGFRTQNIDGLLGRDVLATCQFTYNGNVGWFTLAY